MRISEEQARQIARLARLGMTDNEVDQIRQDLSNILEYFDTLQQVDTKNVDASEYIGNIKTVMRDDEKQASSPIEDILANAPRKEDNFVKTRAIIE